MSAREHYASAKALYKAGRLEESLAILKELSTEYPNEVKLLKAQFQCYLGLGQVEQAEVVVRFVESAFGSEPAAELRRGLPNRGPARQSVSAGPPPLPEPAPEYGASAAFAGGSDDTCAYVHLADHEVAHPQRAARRSELSSHGLKRLGGAVAALVGMPIVALILAVIDGIAFDLFPGNLIALGLLLACPFVVIGLTIQSIDALVRSVRRPQRDTPEQALRSFLWGIGAECWDYSYNVLTDIAMQITKYDFTRDNYLNEVMPAVEYYDRETFEKFWRRVPYSTRLTSVLHANFQDPDTALLKTLLLLKWSKSIPRKGGADVEKTFAESVTWTFVFIRRGGYWFLANGFFWPRGTLYEAEPSCQPLARTSKPAGDG